MVAVKEPCPEVYFPSEAPARAVVAPALESFAAGGRKLGGAVGRDIVRRVKSIEMRAVAVVKLLLVIIVVEFEELTLAAELEALHS